MGLFEHWPYVNFHDLNLDWIIKEIPKVYASRDEAQASAEASAESAAASQLSADAALASQEAAHQSELNAAQSEENASASAQDAQDAVNDTLQQLNLLQSRVDNIIPSGTQTEGNTELLDIRVGANGTTYPSAGDAVRGQYEQLHDEMYAAQNGYIPYDVIENSGVTTSGVISPSSTDSRTDYTYCKGYQTIEVEAQTGLGTIYNCWYDENKTFISSFSMGTSAFNQVATIPENACYFILSNQTQHIRTYKIKLERTLTDVIRTSENITKQISSEGYTVTDKNTAGVTLYSENGYIVRTNGAFAANAGYQCYSFTMPSSENVWFNNPSGWLQIATYTDELFSTIKNVTVKASSVGDLPSAENPLYIKEGYIVAVCVPANSNFNLRIGNGTYTIKGLEELPPIVIKPIYTTQFDVDVLDETTKTYLTYKFFHPTFTDTVTYNGNQTAEIVTYDVWFNNNINDPDGNLIFQGNTNFINALNETGHSGHVGAGHGCCVMDCFQFFADGEPFDPATLQHNINCSSFRFLIKAKHYLIDDNATSDPSHAIPSLDNEGNPIITSEWIFDGTWHVNNEIEMNNHLEIKRNSTTFRQCHAGMLCGFYPNIDNVMLNGRKTLYWNRTEESENVYTNYDESGSGVVFATGITTSLIANDATLFGENYTARQFFTNDNPAEYGKENILAWMPPTSDNRLKMYLMPCVCTESAALLSSGYTPQTFNAGDDINVKMVRTIKIKP